MLAGTATTSSRAMPRPTNSGTAAAVQSAAPPPWPRVDEDGGEIDRDQRRRDAFLGDEKGAARRARHAARRGRVDADAAQQRGGGAGDEARRAPAPARSRDRAARRAMNRNSTGSRARCANRTETSGVRGGRHRAIVAMPRPGDRRRASTRTRSRRSRSSARRARCRCAARRTGAATPRRGRACRSGWCSARGSRRCRWRRPPRASATSPDRRAIAATAQRQRVGAAARQRRFDRQGRRADQRRAGGGLQPASPAAAGARRSTAAGTDRTAPSDQRGQPQREASRRRAARARAVGTGDLLYRYLPRAEGAAQLVIASTLLQPRRARKDVDVDRAGLRPGVQHRVRLAQDQHAGEPGLRKHVRHRADDRGAGAADAADEQLATSSPASTGSASAQPERSAENEAGEADTFMRSNYTQPRRQRLSKTAQGLSRWSPRLQV